MAKSKTDRKQAEGQKCVKCHEPVEPRGYDIKTGKCWFCTFVVLSDEGMVQVREQRRKDGKLERHNAE